MQACPGELHEFDGISSARAPVAPKASGTAIAAMAARYRNRIPEALRIGIRGWRLAAREVLEDATREGERSRRTLAHDQRDARLAARAALAMRVARHHRRGVAAPEVTGLVIQSARED